MLPAGRREFIRARVGSHFNPRRFALANNELDALAEQLGQPLNDQKRYLEHAMAMFAAETWFEAVAPDPGIYKEQLSQMSDHALKLASSLGARNNPVIDYLLHSYGTIPKPFSESDGYRPDAEIKKIVERLTKIGTLADSLSRAFTPYQDQRRHHHLAFRSYLLALISIARSLNSLTLPNNVRPKKPTAFTNFVYKSLEIGARKAIRAISDSPASRDQKFTAVKTLQRQQRISLQELTKTVRPLRLLSGGHSVDMLETTILAIRKKKPTTKPKKKRR